MGRHAYLLIVFISMGLSDLFILALDPTILARLSRSAYAFTWPVHAKSGLFGEISIKLIIIRGQHRATRYVESGKTGRCSLYIHQSAICALDDEQQEIVEHAQSLIQNRTHHGTSSGYRMTTLHSRLSAI